MTATVKSASIPAGIDFFRSKKRWLLTVLGLTHYSEVDWKVESPFGSVESAVVVDKDGNPVFDRPLYREAPNVNIVAWGYDDNGEVHIAMIREGRPHADIPGQPQMSGHPPIVFGQVPMGFIKSGETSKQAVIRIVGDETGATAVIDVTEPKYPWHNPNPTFVATWSDLFFVQVDLKKIGDLKSGRASQIYSAEYVPVPDLIRRIAEGVHDRGTVYRMCTTNSILLIFFATHPELWSY